MAIKPRCTLLFCETVNLLVYDCVLVTLIIIDWIRCIKSLTCTIVAVHVARIRRTPPIRCEIPFGVWHPLVVSEHKVWAYSSNLIYATAGSQFIEIRFEPVSYLIPPSVVSEHLRYQIDSVLISLSPIWYHRPLDDISKSDCRIDSESDNSCLRADSVILFVLSVIISILQPAVQVIRLTQIWSPLF